MNPPDVGSERMAGELKVPEAINLPAIGRAADRLGPFIRETPIWEWRDPLIQQLVGPGTSVVLKLELFQESGTFKARGAMLNVLALSPSQRQAGVTAVSAGNHAAAVAYAAQQAGITAKVVMPSSVTPARLALCRRYGAEVVLTEDVSDAFTVGRNIELEEGRTMVHPFDGPLTSLGTGTLGLEFLRQAQTMDAVIAPVGGGGLVGGIAAAIKLVNPGCSVYGIEPAGNDVIRRSLDSGKPEKARDVKTIADSLSPPYALPFSLDLVRRYVDDVALVTDDQIVEALYLMFDRVKLAVEPAGAAAAAGMLGPLASRLAGKRVGLIVCGANIDGARFADYVARGAARWADRGWPKA